MIATPNQATTPLQSEPSAHIPVPCFRGCPLPPPDALGIVQGPMWAHRLVLDMIKAALPLPALAEHLKIPFRTLIGYIDSPDVQAEIDALDRLTLIRARLLGDIARPVSIRRLLGILERPDPEPRGDDPDADAKHLLRHDELIRRTATTIAKESRALAAKPAPAPRTASVSERTSAAADLGAADFSPRGSGASSQHPSSPPRSSDSSAPSAFSSPSKEARAQASASDGTPPDPHPDSPLDSPSDAPGRHESRARQSPTDALRASAGSTHAVREPSPRSRDRPAA